jgi:hypothetical protein
MPEDPNIQTPEPQAPEAPPAPDPWAPWQQAGFAPDQNPYELRQHLDWVSAITDENRHEQELERSLQEWGHLPQGVTLREMKEWAAQQAAARQDPFGAPQQPQYPGAPQQNGYPTPGYEDPYAQPQPQPVDPNQLRQVWQQDMQQIMQQERAQFEQQMNMQRLQDDLGRQMERVSSQNNLTSVDRTWVEREVDRRLRSGEVNQPQQFATLVDDVWKELSEYRQAAVAGVIQAQQGAPRTMTPTGATPGGLPPAAGIKGALERTAATLGVPYGQ